MHEIEPEAIPAEVVLAAARGAARHRGLGGYDDAQALDAFGETMAAALAEALPVWEGVRPWALPRAAQPVLRRIIETSRGPGAAGPA